MSPRFRQRRKFRRRRILGALAVLIALGGLVWAMGLFRFAGEIPRDVSRPELRTDAIVVLTGGSGRLEAGLDLLADDKADKLLVSGVYRGVDVRQLLMLSKQDPQELECCVEPGHGALDTRGNAVETRAWVERNGFASLRVVTSAYHMPRSLLEFTALMPETELVSHPVFPEHVKQERWWTWPGTSALIVGEYNKFLAAWTRQQVARLLVGEKMRHRTKRKISEDRTDQ